MLNDHGRIRRVRLGRARFTRECPGALSHQGDPGLITQHDNTARLLVFVAPSGRSSLVRVESSSRKAGPSMRCNVTWSLLKPGVLSGTCDSSLMATPGIWRA